MGIIGFQVDKGPRKGEFFEFEDKEIRIGRLEENEICIPDQTISRLHAVVRPEQDGYVIVDKSKNGTFVNGQRISSHLLNSGDRIKIGLCTLVVDIETKTQEFQAHEKTAFVERPGERIPDTADDSAGDKADRTGSEAMEEIRKRPGKKKEEKSLFESPIVRIGGGIAVLFFLLTLLLPKADDEKKSEASSNPFVNEALMPDPDIPNPVIFGRLTPEDSSRAQNLINLAGNAFTRRMSDANNYIRSVQRYQDAIQILGRYHRRTPLFTTATEGYDRVNRALFEAIKIARNDAILYKNQKQYTEALRNVNFILSVLQGRIEDPRYLWAVSEKRELDQFNK